MYFLATIIVVAVVMRWLTRRVLNGDGRNDLARCPKCWYDLEHVAQLRCPECGHRCMNEGELFRPKGNVVLAECMKVATWLFIAGSLWTLSPLPWTQKVPRIALRAMLWASVPAPVSTGGKLAIPSPALSGSFDPWERMVWRFQANRAFGEWADRVLARPGPVGDDELAALVPLAEQVRACYALTRSFDDSETWLSDEFRNELVSRREIAAQEAPNDTDRSDRFDWALAELQLPSCRSAGRDWAQVPDSILERAMNHADPQVRSFARERYEIRSWSKVSESPGSDARKQAIDDLRALRVYEIGR